MDGAVVVVMVAVPLFFHVAQLTAGGTWTARRAILFNDMLLLCSTDDDAPQQQRRASTFRRRALSASDSANYGELRPNIAEPRLVVASILRLAEAEVLDTSTRDGQRCCC